MKFKQDIRELCNQLKPIIGDQADKLWHLYLAEDYKGRQDFAQEIEIIAEQILKQGVVTDQILLSPPPKENSSGSFLLGDVMYNDQKIQELLLSTQVRTTTTMKREDNKVIRIRKSSKAEPVHEVIYDALNLSHRPGRIEKTIL